MTFAWRPLPHTFFQSPFDRARVLADGVQVPVQRGHKQQAFREGDGVGAAQQLRGHKAVVKVAVSAQPAVTYPSEKALLVKKAETCDRPLVEEDVGQASVTVYASNMCK